MYRLLIIIIAFIAICASGASAFAREQLTVKVTQDEQYIRLFFYCKQPISYTTTMSGNELNISFKRDVGIDAGSITSSSSDISAAAFNEKSNVVTITLASDSYKVRKFIGEDFVGVDIIKTIEAEVKKNDRQSSSTQEVEDKHSIATPENTMQRPVIELPSIKKPVTASEVAYAKLLANTKETAGKTTQVEPPVISKENLLTKLYFEWDDTVGASVFKRAGYLWIVFDKAKEVNIENIIMYNAEYFLSAEQLPNRSYTILCFKLRSDVNVVSYRENANWVVGFAREKITPVNTAKIDITWHESKGSQIVIKNEANVKPLRLIDTEVGDEIVILPFISPNLGVNEKYKYVDFAFLETSQGAVIQIISDNVDISVTDTAIKVVGPTNRIDNVDESVLLEQKIEEGMRAKRIVQQQIEFAMLKLRAWMLGSGEL